MKKIIIRKANQATIKTFSEITGLSEHRIRVLRRTAPEMVGWDEETRLYSRTRAMTMARIREKMTAKEAAFELRISDRQIKYYAGKLGLGKRLYNDIQQSTLYLSKGEVRVIHAYMNRYENGFALGTVPIMKPKGKGE
jgi:hypothetical protein